MLDADQAGLMRGLNSGGFLQFICNGVVSSWCYDNVCSCCDIMFSGTELYSEGINTVRITMSLGDFNNTRSHVDLSLAESVLVCGQNLITRFCCFRSDDHQHVSEHAVSYWQLVGDEEQLFQ